MPPRGGQPLGSRRHHRTRVFTGTALRSTRPLSLDGRRDDHVRLGTVELARGRAYNAHQIREIIAITNEHEADWLGRWHEVCGGQMC
jgi:hypothetical protein